MAPTNLRLLFGIRSLSNSGGGAERVLRDVTAGLAKLNHEVAVVTFDEPGLQPFYDFSPFVRLIPLQVGNIRESAGALESARRILPVRSIVSDFAPDVAIGFMRGMFLPLGLAALGTGVPVIARESNVIDRYLSGPTWHRISLRAMSRTFARLVIPSDSARATFPAALSKRMTVIPNPVSLSHAAPTVVDFSGRDRIVISVGRMVPQKDHSTLIRAFGVALQYHPGWKLQLVGDGFLRSELELLCEKLGIRDDVQFLGYRHDVIEILSRASIYVTSSRYESFGVATAEASAAQLPVIGFGDCPGTNEIIVHGVNGVLVASDDRVMRLADALSDLMTDSALRIRLGSAGPALMNRFSPDFVVSEWEALLRQVAAVGGTKCGF